MNGWRVQHSLLLCFAVVPEGFYVKGPGQVAPCPFGEYKQGFAAAPSCTKCAKGVSTTNVGSTSEAACAVVMPSFYPASVQGGIVKSTLQCPQSYYCPGGQASAAFNPSAPNVTGTTVVQCLNGLWTEALGAVSAVQCSECTTGCRGYWLAELLGWQPGLAAGATPTWPLSCQLQSSGQVLWLPRTLSLSLIHMLCFCEGGLRRLHLTAFHSLPPHVLLSAWLLPLPCGWCHII